MSIVEKGEQLVEKYANPQTMLVSFGNLSGEVYDVESSWDQEIQPGHVAHLFATDSRRKYAMVTDNQLIKFCDRPPELCFPPTPHLMAAVIARQKTIIEAEEHARELASRLSAWGATFSNIVVWYFILKPFNYVAYLGQSFIMVIDAVSWSLPNYDTLLKEADSLNLPLLVRKTLAAQEAWTQLANDSANITYPTALATLPYPCSFCDLQNPFDPLVSLWMTGHLFYSYLDQSDQIARLYMII